MDSHTTSKQALERAASDLKAWQEIRELLTEHRNSALSDYDDARDALEKKHDDKLEAHLPECNGLHDLATAASQVLAAEEAVLNTQAAFVNALTLVRDSAWNAYFDCESP